MNIRSLEGTIVVDAICAQIWFNPTADGKSGYLTVTFERMLESAEGSILYSDAFGLSDMEAMQVASEQAQQAIIKLMHGECNPGLPEDLRMTVN